MARSTHPPFADLTELASAAMGGRAVICSDDFFAPMEALIRPEAPVFDPDAYTDRGKLMDGWESRRRRTPGHDWCILELGVPGLVRGVDIDTAFFLGNHPPYGAVDGCWAPGATADQLRDEVAWSPIVREVPLERGTHNLFATENHGPWTHVRLHMIPDGGVARMRVYGVPDRAVSTDLVDLVAAENGGRPIGCSDMFFSPMGNLIAPGLAANMGGGWETRRRRDGGHDWIVLALGVPGIIEEAIVDTHYFKGNFPHACSLETLWWPDAPAAAVREAEGWVEVLPRERLGADQAHHFPLQAPPATHVRLRIYPCGGVSRLRLPGYAARPDPDADPLLSWLNGQADAREAFLACCGSRRWAEAMASHGEWTSRAELYGVAAHTWWRLGDGDWREAFAAHPRLGDKVDSGTWSSDEQAGVDGAAAETLEALREGNAEYEEKFGHVFLVCATGLSAAEMLERLEDRIDNEPAAELRIAAGEQAKITRLRLDKLIAT